MEEPQLKYRITWLSGLLVASVAFIIDLLQFLFSLTGILVIASEIATILTEGLIWIYFYLHGVKFMSGKRATGRLLSFFGETAIEMVPFLNDLPLLGPATIYQIHTVRAEDRETYKEKHDQWVAEMKRQEERVRAYANAVYQARMRQEEELEQIAANDNEIAAENRRIAANDNEKEDEYRMAA